MPHPVIVRAPGLLPMLYTLGELSQELATPVSGTNQTRLKEELPSEIKRLIERGQRGHVLKLPN